jgi:hypothetical protein
VKIEDSGRISMKEWTGPDGNPKHGFRRVTITADFKVSLPALIPMETEDIRDGACEVLAGTIKGMKEIFKADVSIASFEVEDVDPNLKDLTRIRNTIGRLQKLKEKKIPPQDLEMIEGAIHDLEQLKKNYWPYEGA